MLATLPAQSDVRCRTSHTMLGEHPSHAHTPWTRDLQGISHDHSSWFITNIDQLFRIPAEVDLGQAAFDDSVLRVPIPRELTKQGHDHFGDLSWYEHGSEGYLCVPIEGSPAGAGLAFFRGRDLQYLGAARLPERPTSAPLCAIDAGGYAAVPKRGTPIFGRYQIDWDAVALGRPEPLVPAGALALMTERSQRFAPASFGGAAFSADGRLLYVLTGYLDDHACPIWSARFWRRECRFDSEVGGIHVFDVRSLDGQRCDSAAACEGIRVEKSHNAQDSGSSGFAYRYRGTLRESEEPEGVTFWDLDAPGAPQAPGVGGQVHALMLDNELLSEWDLGSIRHYRMRADCAQERVSQEPGYLGD